MPFQLGKHPTAKEHFRRPSSLWFCRMSDISRMLFGFTPSDRSIHPRYFEESPFDPWSNVSKHNTSPSVSSRRDLQKCWCLPCQPQELSPARLRCAKRELLLIQPMDSFSESSCGFCFITGTWKNIFHSYTLKLTLSNRPVLCRIYFSIHGVGSRADAGSRKVNISVLGLLWSIKWYLSIIILSVEYISP